MNKCQCAGLINLTSGRFYEAIGSWIGNRNLWHRGVAQQMRGRSQIAIGDAQKIIKSCVKRTQLSS